MKHLLFLLLIGGLISCGQQAATTDSPSTEAAPVGGGQASVQDDQQYIDSIEQSPNDDFFSELNPDLIEDIQRQIAESKGKITHDTLPELLKVVLVV